MKEMTNRYEGFFSSPTQTELFFQLWSVENPRGTLLLTHGLGEHTDCYQAVAKTLNQEGWEVYGWDLRGHGRSEGKRGFVKNFNDYVADLKAFFEYVLQKRTTPEKPLVMFGHSMGGLITTLFALNEEGPKPDGLVLSAPAFGIAAPVSIVKDQMARIAERWFPTLTLQTGLQYKELSRDESMIKDYSKDPFRHDKVSPGVYLGLLSGREKVMEKISHLQIPCLMQLAGQDRIVSTPDAEKAFALISSSKSILKIYPESYHEIYNDLDREDAFVDFKKFLKGFLRRK
ncbi:MAG: lysophospholipase [Bdellovibrionales bacterium]|nr:lysophospholipase [Bdellovibrionales bacterium]